MKRILQYLAIAATSLVIISCGNNKTAETEADHQEDTAHEGESAVVALTQQQYNTVGIILGNVESKQISGTFKASGVLDVPPQQMVSISIPMGGFLKQTSLLQGAQVKKGQLIAVIENPEYVPMQQEYLEAKSQLEYAEADYQRQQQLASENVNAQKTVQQAKATYQSLQAKVKGLREKIRASGISLSDLDKGDIKSSIRIYAPISGYVTEVNVNLGKYVNPADILFEIVDTEHLHVELTVFEKDVPKLKLGQRVRFTLANETRERTAHVFLIGREISSDRTIRIHCHIDKEDNQLLPGMFLNAIVETGNILVPALPDEAIVAYEDKQYIFIPAEEHAGDTAATEEAPEHHFEMVEIQTGNKDAGYTEVMLPVKSDTKVVLKGAYALLSKMKNSEEGGHGH